MRLFLVRHGNTFGPGDPIIRVGRNEDLPLVAKGLDQAHAVAAAFARTGVRPAAVYCSPLQRIRVSAEIVIADLGLNQDPVIDDRLAEIDYGAWGGLTDDEIAERFGRDVLDAWNADGIWPPAGQWGESEDAVRGRVHGFGREVLARHDAGDDVVVVSSNGTLRYFLDLVGDTASLPEPAQRKMKTGFVSCLDGDAETLTVRTWNRDPATLD